MSKCVNSFVIKRKNILSYDGLLKITNRFYPVNSVENSGAFVNEVTRNATNEMLREESEKKNNSNINDNKNNYNSSTTITTTTTTNNNNVNVKGTENLSPNGKRKTKTDNLDCMEKLFHDLTDGQIIAEKHYVYTTDGYRLNIYRIVKNMKNGELGMQEYNKENGNIKESTSWTSNMPMEDQKKETFEQGKEKKKMVFCLSHGLFESSMNFACKGPNSLAFQIFSEGYDVWLCNNRGNSFTKYVGKNVAIKKLLKKYSHEDMKDLGFNMDEYMYNKQKRKIYKCNLKKNKSTNDQKKKESPLHEGYANSKDQETFSKNTLTSLQIKTELKNIDDKQSTSKTNASLHQRNKRHVLEKNNVVSKCVHQKINVCDSDQTEINKLQKIKCQLRFIKHFFSLFKNVSRNTMPTEKYVESNNSTCCSSTTDTRLRFNRIFCSTKEAKQLDENSELVYIQNEQLRLSLYSEEKKKHNDVYKGDIHSFSGVKKYFNVESVTDAESDTDIDSDDDSDSDESNIVNHECSWTFEDMSTKDLPSIIKYIKNETKEEKIVFVGFSQGSIQLLMGSCLNEFVSNSIKKCYLLSLPIILKKKNELLKSMKLLLLFSKCSNQFLKGKSFVQNIFPDIIGGYLISSTAHILTHKILKYYNGTIEKKEQKIYFFNTPNGSTSAANLQKWISCFNNFPVTDLIEKYSYRCAYPKTLFYGYKDSIVDSKSSIKYMKSIFHKDINVVVNNEWSHLDPLWCDNKQIVSSYILKDVRK